MVHSSTTLPLYVLLIYAALRIFVDFLRGPQRLLSTVWKGNRHTHVSCSGKMLICRKVDACTIMRDPAGTSRGFAFMTFEDAKVVDVVVSREHSLDGKIVS